MPRFISKILIFDDPIPTKGPVGIGHFGARGMKSLRSVKYLRKKSFGGH